MLFCLRSLIDLRSSNWDWRSPLLSSTSGRWNDSSSRQRTFSLKWSWFLLAESLDDSLDSIAYLRSAILISRSGFLSSTSSIESRRCSCLVSSSARDLFLTSVSAFFFSLSAIYCLASSIAFPKADDLSSTSGRLLISSCYFWSSSSSTLFLASVSEFFFSLPAICAAYSSSLELSYSELFEILILLIFISIIVVLLI